MSVSNGHCHAAVPEKFANCIENLSHNAEVEGSSADARDLAQEAYVRLLRLERKDLIREPRPYLYRIAANILYEYELKRKADVAG